MKDPKLSFRFRVLLTTLLIHLLLCISPLFAEPTDFGRIVYVGIDDNIYLLDPATGRTEQLTSDARTSADGTVTYRYPTWSQDDELAFVRYEATRGGQQSASIGLYKSGRLPEFIGDLDGVFPFYLYFSPEGRYLSALGSRTDVNTLGLFLLAKGSDVGETVASGQPFYWEWLNQSDGFFVHSGGTTPNDTLFIQSATSKTVDLIPATPGIFQTPAINYSGQLAAVQLMAGESGSRLVISNKDSSVYKRFAPFRGVGAFDWSPVENRLAVVEGQISPLGSLIGELRIIDMRNPDRPVIQESGIKNAGPFFWSPDGRRIAVFRPNIVGGRGTPVLTLVVSIYDVESNSLRNIVQYLPEAQFMTQIAPFFDQYQRSSTIWSPDNTSIVVSAMTGDGTSGIFIFDVDKPSCNPNEMPEGTQTVLYRPVRHDETPVSGFYPFWSR